MKNLCFVAFAVVTACQLHAQFLPETHQNVLYHQEWEAAYFSFKGDVQACQRFEGDNLIEEWTFAPKKGLEKHVMYQGKNISYSEEYVYNSKNNLPATAKIFYGESEKIGIAALDAALPKANSYSSLQFSFDDKGNLIEEVKDKKNRTVHTYDNAGNRIQTAYYTDKKIAVRDNYSYDEQGRQLKQETYHCAVVGNCDPDGTTSYTYCTAGIEQENTQHGYIHITRQYQYNAQKQLISSESVTTLSGRMINIRTDYNYNDKGELIKVHTGGNVEETTYEYVYDDQGNWIEQSVWVVAETGAQPTLQSRTRRIFRYF